MSNCFDVRHSNVKSQNDMNVECQTVLTFDIRTLNVKMKQMLNSNCFDFPHSNVQCYTNVERQTVLTLEIQMSNVKLFRFRHSNVNIKLF